MADAPLNPIPLPNGLTFYPTHRRQLGMASYLLKEIFKQKFYARKGFELKAGDTVIDVGANMGMFALWVAPQIAPGKVYCVEPTSIVETITDNAQRNKLDNVVVMQTALGKPGIFEMIEYPGYNIVNHSAKFDHAPWVKYFMKLLYGKYEEAPRKIECPCQSLEGLLDSQGVTSVDLLKIDCEGAEYEILDATTDATLQRVKRIAMEFHELAPEHDHRNLVTRLERAGFSVVVEKPIFDYWVLKLGKIWATRTTA